MMMTLLPKTLSCGKKTCNYYALRGIIIIKQLGVNMRNSQVTRQNILTAAEYEFSKNGLYGARIDQIAIAAKANKRMIYAYYESKENLYKCVLCEVYGRLTELEKHMDNTFASSTQAVRSAIDAYFNFLNENRSFVNLVMWENLNEGVYLDKTNIGAVKQPGLLVLRTILQDGITNGEFCDDLDIDQVILSLNTFCFSYFSNKYTLPKVFGMPAQDAKKRKTHICDVILKYILK